jgi:hypothetical protein
MREREANTRELPQAKDANIFMRGGNCPKGSLGRAEAKLRKRAVCYCLYRYR